MASRYRPASPDQHFFTANGVTLFARDNGWLHPVDAGANATMIERAMIAAGCQPDDASNPVAASLVADIRRTISVFNDQAVDVAFNLLPGAGRVELVRGATNDIAVNGTSGATVFGLTTTSKTAPRVTLIEKPAGSGNYFSTEMPHAVNKLLTIVVVGDSIPEGQTARMPLSGADAGMYAAATGITSNFVLGVHCSSACAASVPVLVDWDGVKYMRVQVNGDGYGAKVDVTGGGYFQLTSGGGLAVFVKLRWRLIEAAQVYSGTNTAASTLAIARNYSGEFFGGALASAGMLHHNVLNYAIGGDWAKDVYNRRAQIIALRPHGVLLCAGRNDVSGGSDPTSDILAILDEFTNAGIYVMLTDVVPNNYSAGANVGIWVNCVNTLRATIPAKYGNMAELVDMALPYLNPTGASGAALEDTTKYAADQVHTSIMGTWAAPASIGAAALKARFPNAQWSRRVSGADAYNATTNPKGNLLGVRASLTGTTGTKSGTGVTTPSGNIPTNWNEIQSAGTFNTITYTAPSDATPVPRGGNLPGNWWRMVATNTSGSNAVRYLYADLETAISANTYYRMGITLRLSSVTGLTNLKVFLSIGGTSVVPILFDIGAAAPLTSASLSDSGAMVLMCQPFKLPAGVSGGRLYIQVGCATGGGFTLDIADPFIIPA